MSSLSPPPPPPQPLATPDLLSVSAGVPALDAPHRRDHILHGRPCLASLSQHDGFKVHTGCSMSGPHSSSGLNNIPLCGQIWLRSSVPPSTDGRWGGRRLVVVTDRAARHTRHRVCLNIGFQLFRVHTWEWNSHATC